MPKYIKGQPTPNPGGRGKGNLNKKTILLETFMQTVVEENMDRFLEELSGMKGKQYTDTVMAAMEYLKPKMQRVEVTGADGNEIKINVNSNLDATENV
ncbi:MAG TPA: hypothetical protein VGQ53_08610 [Chitinophagaceae bacterium]|jgi:hypothetical protein|nr:hypothetical protein [Chitinophagaceae bacterium]